eukprot:GHUV01044192.1.p1 GENE.GHUV01044192.1~~GHUV01044192.1.p1  ORF type:complete len:107 (+),score=19.48 GHUV01044192.1:183-503(+)
MRPIPVALSSIHLHCCSSVTSCCELLSIVVSHKVVRMLLLNVLQQLGVTASQQASLIIHVASTQCAYGTCSTGGYVVMSDLNQLSMWAHLFMQVHVIQMHAECAVF